MDQDEQQEEQQDENENEEDTLGDTQQASRWTPDVGLVEKHIDITAKGAAKGGKIFFLFMQNGQLLLDLLYQGCISGFFRLSQLQFTFIYFGFAFFKIESCFEYIQLIIPELRGHAPEIIFFFFDLNSYLEKLQKGWL